MLDDLLPAEAVVPHLGGARRLHGDADVGLRDRARRGGGQARRGLPRIDAEQIPRGASEADLAEVVGLAVLVPAEEDPDAVGGVRRGRLHLRGVRERDVGVLRPQQLGDALRERAFEAAAVLLPELLRVGEPGEGVAERPDREFDEDGPSAQVHEVVEDGRLQVGAVPDADAERHVVFLCAADPSLLRVAGEEDVAGLVVLDLNVPRAAGQEDARAVVEVEAYAARALLRGGPRHRDEERVRRRGGDGAFAHFAASPFPPAPFGAARPRSARRRSMARIAWRPVMARVHSNWRSVPL